MSERQQPTAGDRTRPVKGASARAVFLQSGIGLLLVGVLVVVGAEIGHHLQSVDAWLAGLGPWGVLAFAALFVVATSFFVPEIMLAVTAGALFGMAEGLAAVVAGGLAASVVQFAVSRWVLRSWIERTLAARPSLAAIRRALIRNEVRLQVLIRLTPLNPATLNYLLGATGVSFRGFLLAIPALLPHLVVEVYLGYGGRHIAGIAGRAGSILSLHDIALLGGLVMCVVALALVARAARRAAGEALARSGDARPAE